MQCPAVLMAHKSVPSFVHWIFAFSSSARVPLYCSVHQTKVTAIELGFSCPWSLQGIKGRFTWSPSTQCLKQELLRRCCFPGGFGFFCQVGTWTAWLVLVSTLHFSPLHFPWRDCWDREVRAGTSAERLLRRESKDLFFCTVLLYWRFGFGFYILLLPVFVRAGSAFLFQDSDKNSHLDYNESFFHHFFFICLNYPVRLM